MKSYAARIIAASALLLSVAVPSLHGTAAASLNGAVIIAPGTVVPGWPVTGSCQYQRLTFDGHFVAAGTHAGMYFSHFDATSSVCETLQAGAGSGNFSGDVTGSASYSRTGNLVTLSGVVQLSGGPVHALLFGLCILTMPSQDTLLMSRNTLLWTCALALQ